MIDKCEDGMFVLNCDICGEQSTKAFYEFMDTVNYRKFTGWTSQKVNGEWEDVCPECQ